MSGRTISKGPVQDDLRSVRPLDLAGKKIVPAADIGKRPTIEFVDPCSLYIEAAYQREVIERGARLIRKIVEQWNWTHFKPPIVCRCSDSGKVLVVIDGQHTAIAAATHGGIPVIPVLVVTASQIKDRAKSFVAHNRDRIALTPMQIHFAALVAGDLTASKIQAACDEANVTISRSYYGATPKNTPKRVTISVEAMRIVLKFHGRAVLVDTMRLLGDSGMTPIGKRAIFAMAALLVDERKVDRKNLVAAIGSKTPTEWDLLVDAEIAKSGATRRNGLVALWSRAAVSYEPPKKTVVKPSIPAAKLAAATAPPAKVAVPSDDAVIERNGIRLDTKLGRLTCKGKSISLGEHPAALCAALARISPALGVFTALATKVYGTATDATMKINALVDGLNPALREVGLTIRKVPKMGCALSEL